MAIQSAPGPRSIEQHGDLPKINRRAMIGTVAGALTTAAVFGGYNVIGSGERDTPAAPADNDLDTTVNQAGGGSANSEITSGVASGEENFADISTLARSENLTPPGYFSAEAIQDARANSTKEEYIEMFYTKKEGIFINGEFSPEKAASIHVVAVDAFLKAGCDKETLASGNYLNDLTADNFVNDMAVLYDIPTFRGICGYSHNANDADIKSNGYFTELSAAAAASRRFFWENAKREGGNLNQRFVVSLVSGELIDEEELGTGGVGYWVKIKAKLSNAVDGDTNHQPLPIEPIEGHLIQSVDIWEGFDRAAFTFVQQGHDTTESPFDQLAQLR